MKKSENCRVHLNGYIDVPDHRLEAVKAALPQHIALTHAEDGCISFEVVEDSVILGRFMVSEVFKDQAAFDTHQERTKSSEWFEVTKGIPREYKITLEAESIGS